MQSIKVADFGLGFDPPFAIALPSLAPRDVAGGDAGSSGIELWLIEVSGSGPLAERLCFRIDGYFEGVEYAWGLFGHARSGCDLLLGLDFCIGGKGLCKSNG